MVHSVKEQITEELTLEVQEVIEETSQEQHIIVEFLQPTKEEATLTAVEPVQESVSERFPMKLLTQLRKPVLNKK